MGNCLCKPDIENGFNKKLRPVPASKGVFDKDYLHVQSAVAAAGASSAHFAAAAAQNTYSTIHKTAQDAILIGLVEGVSPNASLTAAFISKILLQTFEETSLRYGGLGDQHNSEDILRTTLQYLHHKCLASPDLSKTSSGVSATLALVDLATYTCTVANVGYTQCLLAGVSGSFNSTRPHYTWASTLHTTENKQERIRSDRHKTTLLPLFKPRKKAQQPVYLTRSLGIVNNNNSGSYTEQWSSQKTTNSDVQINVNTFQLTPEQGHLIIGSAGFWDVVAPPAVALRAHLFSKFQEAQKSVVETALKDGVPIPSPAEHIPLLAEHLINFAVATAADRLSAADAAASTCSPSTKTAACSFNAEDVKNLPFELDPLQMNASQEESGTVSSGNDAATSSNTNNDGDNIKIRKDVFGDLACVTISFHWPNINGHQSMFHLPPPSRVFHPASATRTASTGGSTRFRGGAVSSSSCSSDLAPLARYRWLQLRMVVDYHRLYRRDVQQRWHETVSGILKKAHQRAKAVAHQVENEYNISVNVSPLMKLSAKDGHPLPSSAFNVRASINF